jgi:hypothetical protein
MFNPASWVRKIFAQAGVAGFYDAISAAQGIDSSHLTNEQAAKALIDLLSGAGAVELPALPQAGQPAAHPAPQLTPAPTSGQGALAEPPKRGPGRPRKYQEPPQE